MGLDVYIYRRPFYKVTSYSSDDVMNSIYNNCSDEVITALKQLNEYSIRNDKDFNSLLVEAINNYIIKESNVRTDIDKRFCSTEKEEEVAYFRKFWWIVNRFNYGNEHYATDMRVSKDDLSSIVEYSRKLILTVEKAFTDKGLVIDKSTLNYKGPIYYYDVSMNDYLSFSNSLITDELVDLAEDICSKALESLDSFLFHKVCYMYIQFKYILESTDWDNEAIYLNADW